MFFRFAAALILSVAVSLMGIAMEKQTLRMRRTISARQYVLDVLGERHAQLRLQAQLRTAPALAQMTLSGERSTSGRLYLPVLSPDSHSASADADADFRESQRPVWTPAESVPAELPLLRFQRPYTDSGQ